MAHPNCGCSCIQLIEGKRYSLVLDDETIAIREADTEQGGYLLKRAGATEHAGSHRVVLILSFEEKTEG